MRAKRLEKSFIPWVIGQLLEFWPYYIAALGALFVLHYSQSQLPLIAKEMGDSTSHQISPWRLILLALVILVFRTASRLTFFYPARVQQKLLRIELIDALEQNSPQNYFQFSGGQLFQILFNDFNSLRAFVGFALLQVGNIIIAATVFLPQLKKFDSELITSLSPLLGSIIIFSVILRLFQKFVKRAADLQGEVQNHIIESYQGKKTIANFHSEQSFVKRFNQLSGEELRAFFLSGIGPVLSMPLVKLGMGISLLWGAVIIQRQNLGAPTLVYYSGFLYLLLEPLMFLSWIGVVTAQSLASWRRIKNLWDTTHQKVPADKFDKVEFPNARWSIVIGETGCGKSTLLKEVALDLIEKGKSCSLVFQSPHLYNDTIGANIFQGVDPTPADLLKVESLIKLFDLNNLGPTCQEILATEVGENGKKLSGGQAKRVCLIRSLMSKADYLLWDDPFSNVDLITEDQIIRGLKSDEEFRHKTFILTCHRLSTARATSFLVYINEQHKIDTTGETTALLNGMDKIRIFFEKQMVQTSSST